MTAMQMMWSAFGSLFQVFSWVMSPSINIWFGWAALAASRRFELISTPVYFISLGSPRRARPLPQPRSSTVEPGLISDRKGLRSGQMY